MAPVVLDQLQATRVVVVEFRGNKNMQLFFFLGHYKVNKVQFCLLNSNQES